MKRSALAIGLALAGCGDVVIGTFVATDSDGGGPPLPGGCVHEDFDIEFDADIWIAWGDGNGSTAVSGDALTMIPPNAGLVGTGLVLSNQWAFDYSNASARVQVLAPPDPASTTEMFLQITEQVPQTMAILSFGLFQGGARVRGLHEDGTVAFEQPIAGGYPQWIGIRTDNAQVHFETSTDGASWTDVGTFALPATFDGAAPLVMAWNNEGFASTPQAVVVDSLEVCAQ